MKRIVQLFLLAPVLALAVLTMTCVKGKDYEQEIKMLVSPTFGIEKMSFTAIPFSVTDAMRTVPGQEDNVALSVGFEEFDERKFGFYVLTEDNYYAWEQGLPFTAVDPQANRPSTNGENFWLPRMKNGNYYFVFDNRNDPLEVRGGSAACWLSYLVFK